MPQLTQIEKLIDDEASARCRSLALSFLQDLNRHLKEFIAGQRIQLRTGHPAKYAARYGRRRILAPLAGAAKPQRSRRLHRRRRAMEPGEIATIQAKLKAGIKGTVIAREMGRHLSQIYAIKKAMGKT